MELFGFKVRFDEDGKLAKDFSTGIPPVLNFDNFSNSFVTLFVLMTKQNWNNILFDHYR